MTISTPQSHFLPIANGPRYHYTQYGNPSGPLLLLLHGLGGSTSTFLPLLPHLPRETYNIISLDLEGFGKTALSSTSLSVEQYVRHLNELISSLQKSDGAKTSSARKPITIIAHNLGTIIALHYAALNPTAVAGLALLGVQRSASHIPITRQRMHNLAEKVRGGSEGISFAASQAIISNFTPGETDQDGRKEYIRREVLSSNPEAYALVCEAMVSKQHTDPDYSRIQCPVVFVCGRGDVISPVGKSKELSALMGGKTVVEIVGGGHQAILSDLEGVKDAMVELFRLVDAELSI